MQINIRTHRLTNKLFDVVLPPQPLHGDDIYLLEHGVPLEAGQVSLFVGLILGNDRSCRGGGGKMTPMVEVVVPSDIRVADFKATILKATWHLNEPRISEPGQWRFRKVTLMGDLGDLWTEHGDISGANLSNGSTIWLEQGTPPKKDARAVSVKLWIPNRLPLEARFPRPTTGTTFSTRGEIPQDMPETTGGNGESKHTSGPALSTTIECKPPDDGETVNFVASGSQSDNAGAVGSASPASVNSALDPEMVLAESQALRKDALLALPVFEALGTTTLSQIKMAVLKDPRVQAAVAKGLCGEAVCKAMLEGECGNPNCS